MGKKLLLIAPVFFGYYKDMIKEASDMGYDVDYICDAPSNSNFLKALGRLNNKLISISVTKYFKNKVLPQIQSQKYDNVLVVGGMTFAFTPDMVKKIRKLQDKAVFSLYQWDSERNLPYAVNIHKYFDKIFTFDRQDSIRNSAVYTFLPLFYNRVYEDIGSTHVASYKYDCMYVGTAHPKKYQDINSMAEALKPVYSKQFIYHYMPSKLKFMYHKVLAPEYKNAKYSEFQTNKVSLDRLKKIVTESKSILDAPQAGQTGLTIRTIECLGAKRKLITTNADVINYDFYKPENIYVYDGNFDFDNIFFHSDYQDIDKNIYKKYSLNSWLQTVLK